MEFKELFLSLLFPRRCPICHDIVVPKGGLICPECAKKLPYVQEPTCLRCGKEIASEEIEYCYDCSHHTRSFEKGVALAVYDPVMRESVRMFKNGGRREYAGWYARAIWNRYSTELERWGVDVLVPVPLHRSRLRKRGYNQAEILAMELSRYINKPVYRKALIRIKKTVAQKYLGAGERNRNLESVFGPGRQSVTDKTVLLVDDIYTTGGTAEACTRALLEAGARAVYLVNLCIGENDG